MRLLQFNANSPKPIVDKVVKQFARSSAGEVLHKPEMLRPPHVLLKTVGYLINE